MYRSILRTVLAIAFIDLFYYAFSGTFKMNATFVIVALTLFFFDYIFSKFRRQSILMRKPTIHEEREEYKLHPFTTRSEGDEPVYLEILNDDICSFYSKETQDGKAFVEPMSIHLGNAYIMDTTTQEPVVIEITKSHEYPMSKFETWWFFGELEVPDNEHYFEVYIPVSSILRTYK